jgi:hypothetical protein
MSRNDIIDFLLGDIAYAVEHLQQMRLDERDIDVSTEKKVKMMAKVAAKIHMDLFPDVDFLYPPREKKRQRKEIKEWREMMSRAAERVVNEESK